MDQHDLLVRLKELASILGRTPSRDQFCKEVKNGKVLINKHFRSWALFIQASGLEPLSKPRRINNDVFKVAIEPHLEAYNKLKEPIPGLKANPTYAVISDIHWPFSNQAVIEAFIAYVASNKPDWVIINGDAWDMYSHSKYPRSHNVFTPKEEQSLARTANEEFWARIKKASPNSKCIQMLGNHDIRPLKRVLETYPEAEDWIKEKLEQMFTFEGVKTYFDAREELQIAENILVFHGYRTQLGSHRDYTLFSCINGHTHVGGVVYRKIRGTTLFEANSGVAGDPQSKGLSYTPQKITHWTPGFLIGNQYGPQFIPV